MNPKHLLRHRLMNDDLDAGGTGTLDRGDDFDPGAAAAAADAEAGKGGVTEAATAAALEAELAAKAADVPPAAEEDDDEDKDADKTKPRGKRIPLDRHEAILAKARETADELRRENAALKALKDTATLSENVTATDAVVAQLEKEYATLLTDGEIDKATAVMSQIRRAEREMAEAKSDLKIRAAQSQAAESARYMNALDRIEAQYPMLDEAHVDFDAEAMAEVILMKNGYEAQGMNPTEAMQKAVRKELGATTAAQIKTLAPAPKSDAASVAAARKLAAAAKTIAAVESTPASTTKVGIDSDKAGGAFDAKAVMKMNQQDFAKLPEEVLSRMRGDTI